MKPLTSFINLRRISCIFYLFLKLSLFDILTKNNKYISSNTNIFEKSYLKAKI